MNTDWLQAYVLDQRYPTDFSRDCIPVRREVKRETLLFRRALQALRRKAEKCAVGAIRQR